MYPLFPPPPALLLPVLPTKSSLTLTHRHSHTRTHIITHTHAHTHTSSLTHLLRNIFANSDVECIIRAKNTSIKPDRSDLMTRSEKQCEVNHSTSLLDKSNHSDAARSSSIDSGNSDCENRTGTEVKSVSLDVLVWSNLKKETIGKVVLGLAKSHLGNLIWTLKQVRRSSVPDRYHRMS